MDEPQLIPLTNTRYIMPVMPFSLDYLRSMQKYSDAYDYKLPYDEPSNNHLLFHNIMTNKSETISNYINTVSRITPKMNSEHKDKQGEVSVEHLNDISELKKLEFIFAHFKKVTTTAAFLNYDLKTVHDKQFVTIKNKLKEINILIDKAAQNVSSDNYVRLRQCKHKLQMAYEKIVYFKSLNEFDKIKMMLSNMCMYGNRILKIIKHLNTVDLSIADISADIRADISADISADLH